MNEIKFTEKNELKVKTINLFPYLHSFLLLFCSYYEVIACDKIFGLPCSIVVV